MTARAERQSAAGSLAEGSAAPDLRLAGFALGTWLAALTALYLPARGGILLGAAALLLGVAGATLMTRPAGGPTHGGASGTPRPRPTGAGRGGRRPTWAVRWIGMAVLLGVGCGAVATGTRVGVREAEPVVALVEAGDPVRIEGVVRDDPRALRGSPGLPPTYLIAVDLVMVQGDGPPVRMSARALVLGGNPGWRGLLPGQRVAADGGRLLPPRGGDLRAAVVSIEAPPTLVGRPPWAQRAAGVLRAGLQRACEPLTDDAGGLLPGLVVGDTSRLDPAIEEDFRTTGMTHLNAVSGLNVA